VTDEDIIEIRATGILLRK